MSAVADLIAYTPYDRITLDGVDYDFLRWTTDGYMLQKSETDLVAHFTFQQMSDFERSPLYRVSRDHYRLGKLNARLRAGVDEFAMIPQAEQPAIIWKYEICKRIQRLVTSKIASMSNDGLDKAIELITPEIAQLDCAKITPSPQQGKGKRSKKSGKPRKLRSGKNAGIREMPSSRTVQRWIAILEKCDWEIAALRDGHRRCGNTFERHPAEIEELIHEHARAYASQARPTREHQFDLLEGAVNALNEARSAQGKPAYAKPSMRKFNKEISALGAFHVYACRHTLAAAQKKFAGQDDGVQATRIGERVEIDGWRVSLQTLLIKARVWKQLDDETRKNVANARPWLILALDRASRIVLAMRLVQQINSAEAIATIRMIFADKTALLEGTGARSPWSMATGIGELSYDRGSEFSAGDTFRAVISTSATKTHPPKGHPQLRAAGERIFLTVERRFMGHFPGRTFSNVVERGDYPSEKKASIPIDALAQMLVRHVIDDYHNRPHHGLGGETPLNAWNRLIKQTGRIPVPDKHLQRHIFGVERVATLRKAGIEQFGLRFASKELFEKFLRVGSKKVTIRVDPTDIGAISVKFGEEWITALNVKRHLEGTTLSAWLATANELSARYKAEAALSRAIVLAALRDNETLARDLQRENGIAEELVTNAQIERKIRHMSLGFRLPCWDDDRKINDPRYDLLDDVIEVDDAPDMIADEAQTLPVDASADESTSWEMGDRSEGTS